MIVRKASRLKKRVCKVCGVTFQAQKSNAVFCSPKCKSTDQRNRNKAVQNGLTIEQARVTILTPELIKVSKDRICKVCGTTFQGNKNAVFCSDACKHKDFRSKVNTNTVQLREAVKAQSNIIKSQGVVINTVLPDYLFNSNQHPEQKITEKLSVEIGKDLTECKRPDGEHLYTKQDVLILLAKLCRVNWGVAAQPLFADLLSWFDADRRTKTLIADFERRFECKFDEIKQANSDMLKDNGENDYSIITKYGELKYSR